jgi:hypothetical protein
VPEALRLHVHLQKQRPLLVVGVGEHRPLDGASALLDDALDDDLATVLAPTARHG